MSRRSRSNNRPGRAKFGLLLDPTEVDPTPASFARERAALTAKMHGAHAPAYLAVAGDELLCDRLRAATLAGMPPVPLDNVPQYRRAAQVDDALDTWERSTRGGPCAYCGCVVARRGREAISLRTVPTDPTFTNVGDRKACQWCADFIGEYGEELLSENVYTRAAGLRGMDGSRRVLFAHELDRPTGPEPWAHVDPEQVRADAILHHHWSDFSERPHSHQPIPGLVAPWTARPDRAIWGPMRDLEADDLARERNAHRQRAADKMLERGRAEYDAWMKRLARNAEAARRLTPEQIAAGAGEQDAREAQQAANAKVHQARVEAKRQADEWARTGKKPTVSMTPLLEAK